jgi:hypothetical protein
MTSSSSSIAISVAFQRLPVHDDAEFLLTASLRLSAVAAAARVREPSTSTARRREAELGIVRADVLELAEMFRTGRLEGHPAELVEVVTGADAIPAPRS